MVEYAIFDLYHALVELVFGNFLVAIIGIGIVFFIIALLLRISLFASLSIIGLFFFAMFTGFYGSPVGLGIFILSGVYFATALVRLLIHSL